MRFKEFNLVEAEQSKFYAAGDSHAQGIASSSHGWINLGVPGAKASGFSTASLDKIPAGSIVALSLGHNDATGSNESPQSIASHVSSVIDTLVAHKLKVYFVLFPTGDNEKTFDRNEEVRKAIYAQVKSKVLGVYDLNRGPVGSDKIHAAPATYKMLGDFIVNNNTEVRAKGKPSRGATVNPSQVASYLKSKGLDRNQVLGILANIQGESGFNAGVKGDLNKGGSIGLFQWNFNAGRAQKMISAVGDDWATDWKGQVDYALSEPAGQKYLQTKFSSPQEATAWWVKYFEIPANKQAAIRTRIGYLDNFA